MLYVKTTKMLRALLASRADHSWEKRIRRYIKPDVLILDDFGLSPFSVTQTENIYEIITEKHLKSSIIITSNLLCGAPHKRFFVITVGPTVQ